MSSSVSQVRAEARTRTLRWFVLAVIFALVWVIVWLISEPPKALKTSKNADITSQDLPLPKSIDSLAQFSKEVPMVDIASTVVRDMRNYPVEFKDKKFFEKHQNRWTVQVMDVAQNDIITGYLKGRQDRDKFVYFRYHNTNNELRYILTYGVMGSAQEALGAIKTVDFGLPSSVTPVTEQMSRYVGIIDKYERTEEIVDSAPNAPRKIKLQATRNEIPAVAPKPAEPKEAKKKEPAQPAQKSTTPKEQVKPRVVEPNKEPTDKPKQQPAEKPKAQPTDKPKPQTEKPKAPPAEKPKPQAEKPKAREEERPKQPAKEKEAPKKPADEPKEPKKSAEPVTNTPKTPGSADD